MALFRRPSVFYTLFVTFPLTVFFGVFCILFSPIEIFLVRRRYTRGELSPIASFIKSGWCYCMVWVHSIKIEVFGPGAEKVKNYRGVVFVSNHQSSIDIPVHMGSLPRHTSFVAKKELLRVPIFGLGAAIAGTFFIDRSKGTKNKSLKKMQKALNAGINMFFYPEGTRSADGALLPFKRGAFVLAIEAQAPVVPLAILDTRLLCPKKRLSVAPGTVHLYVGEPISTKGLTVNDRHEFCEQVRNEIAKQLDKFNESHENRKGVEAHS